FLSVECPVLVAPAMNPNMWRHRAVQENIAKLKSWGVRFVDPSEGAVACGDFGYGKLAEVETIYRVAVDVLEG
ncbi:MAG TPA: flavoprotein, partial [Spirochaetota bacterium]|nr:flavoprotein [Spirochaetota bacterium]